MTNRSSRAATFVLAMVSIVLAGCDPLGLNDLTYTYGGVTYDSSDDALEAQQRDDEILLAAIERRAHAVAPTVRILIPSQDRLYELTYHPRCAGYFCASPWTVSRARNHYATSWYDNLMSTVHSVQRSHIFESSEVEEYDAIDRSSIAASDAPVLAMHEAAFGHTEGGWFLYTASDPDGTYLPFDESISRERRVNAWLDALEALVRQQQGSGSS